MNTRILLFIFSVTLSPVTFAASFFNVTSSGPAAQISIELCLNGRGSLSCQIYKKSALNLTIATTILGHTYKEAGIRILTPGYLPTGCTRINNGYCLFTVSDTASASVPVIASACPSQANDLISFAAGCVGS